MLLSFVEISMFIL